MDPNPYNQLMHLRNQLSEQQQRLALVQRRLDEATIETITVAEFVPLFGEVELLKRTVAATEGAIERCRARLQAISRR